jgi:hypothetical protein
MTSKERIEKYIATRRALEDQARRFDKHVPTDCGDGVRRALDYESTPPLVQLGRSACPRECSRDSGQRICTFMKCPWNTWRIEPDDVAGRPWPGFKPSPLARASAWKQSPLPGNCGLDIVERAKARGEGASTQEIALAYGQDESLMRRVVRRALIKLRVIGVSIGDLRAAMEH